MAVQFQYSEPLYIKSKDRGQTVYSICLVLSGLSKVKKTGTSLLLPYDKKWLIDKEYTFENKKRYNE